MANTKKYWQGIEEVKQDPEFLKNLNQEFSGQSVEDFLQDENLVQSNVSRRDFLKFLGFSITAASLAACETPVIKSIPYAVKPEEIIPGKANWYASAYYDGNEFGAILVKTREGRPIFIQGNKEAGVWGAINARINSSVLSLYDTNRYQAPLLNGKDTTWDQLDKWVSEQLNKAVASSKPVYLVTPTVISPSTQAIIDAFKAKYSGTEGEQKIKHVTFDAVSYSAILNAHQESFGRRVIPSYDFSKAKTIVGIGADFLANWLNAPVYAAQYAKTRKPENGQMSRHYQFESILSVTGANADVRMAVKPSQWKDVLVTLYNKISVKLGGSKLPGKEINDARIDRAADDLLKSKGESLVVCGWNNTDAQIIVNAINSMLGNYGKTLSIADPLLTKKGDDNDVVKWVLEVEKNNASGVIFWNCDPVYTLPDGDKLSEALQKIEFTVAIVTKPNETSTVCKAVAPDHHYLESWGDAQPATSVYFTAQPVIAPLYNTRQFQDSLLKWSGNSDSYENYLKNFALQNILKTQDIQQWNKLLHDGIFKLEVTENTSDNVADVKAAADNLSKFKNEGEWELVLYQNVTGGVGQSSDNPWLQELPDPITKITWDNYVTINPADAKKLNLATHYGEKKPADMVTVTVGNKKLTLPAIAQPGQAPGTLGIALGYGRKVGKMKDPVGVNAFVFSKLQDKGRDYVAVANLEKTNETYPIASTQTHYTIMERHSIIRETDLETFKNSEKEVYNPTHVLKTHEGDKPVSEISLWREHPYEASHQWGMSIDLNACIGCGACVTSCISENNTPVVGKDEVRRMREMHWLRIDRYYSSDMTKEKAKEQGLGKIAMYRAMEEPEDTDVEVVFQPMMCQHCNHAPCETVCPVAATTHSLEGLNMMAYNRCIGTRYCANNCPYKVRRFNWFNYMAYEKFNDFNPSQDETARLVLNPDVVVRSRGVIEKCSMCIQRIQEGKLKAKSEGRPVKDGEIQTACAAACPTNAITFGDLNDKKSQVRKESESSRAYRVIEEVGTKPNIYYQVKVRNGIKVNA